MEDEPSGGGNWHLSKAVPLSLILAIALQTIGLIIWGTRLDSRVGTLETSQAEQNTRITALEATTTTTAKELAVISARQADVIKRLDVNSVKLDQILDYVFRRNGNGPVK